MTRLQLAVELIRFGELTQAYEAAGWAIPDALSVNYHAAARAWDRDAEAARHRAKAPVYVPAPRTPFVVDDPRATALVRSSR